METSLIKEKYVLVENFLDHVKILVCGKVVDHGKIKGLSFLKTKSYNKTNSSVETIKIYISKSREKTLFCVSKHHNQSKPEEQLLTI